MIKVIKEKDFDIKKLRNSEEEERKLREVVKAIMDDVKERGDEALIEYTEKFDGHRPKALKVTEDERRQAEDSLDEEMKSVIRASAENIRNFHRCQIDEGFVIEEEGKIIGERVLPIERVGIYVPGGTASYPSTVLMNGIPAKLAGCKKIVMVTPAGKNGKIADELLFAANIAGIDEIYKIGGAQAIGALLYGTETVPNVYKVTGPGNRYVAEAKRQSFGRIDIDMIAGPSEILIIADENANPVYIAADMLSQAEHDKDASSILVTTSKELSDKVREEIEIQLKELDRETIAAESIKNKGLIVIAETMDSSLDLANEIAPEHLELMVENPIDFLGKITNAGSVFMGEYSPEPLGDYFAGTNHTLPTSGTAKFASALSVDSFVKKSQFICYSREALIQSAEKIMAFAKREGLTAHGKSIEKRR